MYASQFADPSGEEGIARKTAPENIARFALAYLTPGSPSRELRRIGRLAMRARTGDETERVEVILSRMGDRSCPDRRLLITAVDAGTGEPAVFDRSTGVDLVRAVSASCAVPLVWPPVVVNGWRYVDGGMRSPKNADLAVGASHIIVFAPSSRPGRRARGEREHARPAAPGAGRPRRAAAGPAGAGQGAGRLAC